MMRFLFLLVAACCWSELTFAGFIPPFGYPDVNRMGDTIELTVGNGTGLPERVSYDTSTQRLSYTTAGTLLLCSNGCAEETSFNGLFAWSATVDGAGNVLDPGQVLLTGDLGGSQRILAQGKIGGLGFGDSSFVDSVEQPDGSFLPEWNWANLLVLMKISYLDEAVSDMGRRWGFILSWDGFGPVAPFNFDFDCTSDATTDCEFGNRHSETWIADLTPVSEPGTLLLLLSVLASLALERYVRQAKMIPLRKGFS